ncbi:hypothetical protein V7112_22120, partial [Bacillus sp. JJ1566]|uniref:PGN_0703 family putative restriction endonuclease n=1 Tax=Bacillus sp. JJ1566 TaxID=3122961 RepID=UPI002FFF6067
VIDILKVNISRRVDSRGYLYNITDNLIQGINLVDFQSDLEQGSGNELDTKFLAIHSSSALVVNHFAYFKKNIESLNLFSFSNFSCLKFEEKLPTGLKGTPPNLDVLIKSQDYLIGVESKFLEFTVKKKVKFSDSYCKENLPFLENHWFDLIRQYQDKSMYLDIAQLIKHSIGLLKIKDAKRPVLIYIFWEPENHNEIALFNTHRDELVRFTRKLSAIGFDFQWYSYRSLWELWDNYNDLRQLSHKLRERYSIKL